MGPSELILLAQWEEVGREIGKVQVVSSGSGMRSSELGRLGGQDRTIRLRRVRAGIPLRVGYVLKVVGARDVELLSRRTLRRL